MLQYRAAAHLTLRQPSTNDEDKRLAVQEFVLHVVAVGTDTGEMPLLGWTSLRNFLTASPATPRPARQTRQPTEAPIHVALPMFSRLPRGCFLHARGGDQHYTFQLGQMTM